jgi:predicted transcriptional regulator
MTAVDPVQLLRDLVVKWGSQAAVARRLKVSPSYIGDILKGAKSPGPKVLSRLGIKRKLVYVQ